ncbi:MAG: PAS domain S-box protein [Firmicutes bacterium]|nr:PAS domain S-box protein [Bacillota bacterium]
MKLDIENKILIPFLILVIVPVIAVGIVSYIGGYQIFTEAKKKELNNSLNETISILELIEKDVSNGIITEEEAQIKALEYLSNFKKNNLCIVDISGNTVFDNSSEKIETEDLIYQILEDKKGRFEGNQNFQTSLISYRSFEKWGWIIIMQAELERFMSALLEVQKYTLLVAIIAAIIAVELTIIIAHNISKPIKKLAEICNSISKEGFRGKLEYKRNDEIGILASAFNEMIVKLENNTRELIRMKDFNEDILRSTTTGIIAIDNRGEFISMNRAAERILGIRGKNKNGVIYHELIELLKNTLKEDNPVKNIVRTFSDESGKSRFIEINTSLLKNEEGNIKGALCSFNDITERKEFESKIDKIDRLASLGELAAGLAHEIRNPLAGIKTSTQVLANRAEQNDANVLLFDKIISEIDRMNKLITDLLNFAKPPASRLEKRDITKIIRESAKFLEEHFRKCKVNITFNFPLKEYFVLVDGYQMKQIFLNLFMNAIKAMPEGGRISVYIAAKGDFIEIYVRDTGKGISQENLPRIFDPFFTTDPKGTGLGLSVVQKLVIQNGGEIDVKSELNKGTTFCIKLPVIRGEKSYEKEDFSNR